MTRPARFFAARALVGLAVGAAAAALVDPDVSPPRLARVYLPAVMGPAPTPRPSPAPTATDIRTTLRPSTASGLAAALRVPGALVLPAPGEYSQGDQFRVAAGVTLDGRGQVVLRGGLRLSQADGATIRGISVTRSRTDAIGIDHTGGTVTIERVDLTGAGDGVLDVVRSVGVATVYVRDSVLHDDEKCMLVGHYDPGLDLGLTVHLERVVFRDCDARAPKSHRATVTMTDSRVIRWGSRAVDAQLGARITLTRVRFDEGPQSGPRIRLATGGAVAETGSVVVPYRPEARPE